jgi:hypothetical protein
MHRGIIPSPFRGHWCAGARTKTQKPASALLSQQVSRYRATPSVVRLYFSQFSEQCVPLAFDHTFADVISINTNISIFICINHYTCLCSMCLRFPQSHFSHKILTSLIAVFRNAFPANGDCVLCNCVAVLNNKGVNTYCSSRTTLRQMRPLLLSLLQTQFYI